MNSFLNRKRFLIAQTYTETQHQRRTSNALTPRQRTPSTTRTKATKPANAPQQQSRSSPPSHPQNLFAPLHSSLRDLNTGVPDVSHVQPPSAAYLSAPSQSEVRTGTVSSPVDSQPPPRTSAAASHAGLGCTKVVLAPGRSGREKIYLLLCIYLRTKFCNDSRNAIALTRVPCGLLCDDRPTLPRRLSGRSVRRVY